VSEYIGMYGNCTGQHSGCCDDGLLCYSVDSTYSQCRAPNTCPDCEWSCQVVPQPCSAEIGKYGNCRDSHCCADGLVCYEQDAEYAQCLPRDACPQCQAWTCAELVHGLYDGTDGAILRRRSLGFRNDAPPELEATPASLLEADQDTIAPPHAAATHARRSAPSEEAESSAAENGATQSGGMAAGLVASVLVLAAAGVLVRRARADLKAARAVEIGKAMESP